MSSPEDRRCRPDENLVNLMMALTHDIRGPLVSVMAGLKVVLHGSYGAVDAGVSAKIAELHADLARLLGTADEYLGRTSCLGGALSLGHEALHLRDDILVAVLDELAREIQANRVLLQLRLEQLPAAHGVAANRLGLKIVYRNLLRNAVAHGGAGCTVICGYQELADRHRLNVFNSGAPIPPESRRRLFTKFGALDTPGATRRRGVGLGLFLASEIVRCHGGALWYEARPEGSDFVFTLPKPPAAGSPGEIDADAGPTSREPRPARGPRCS